MVSKNARKLLYITMCYATKSAKKRDENAPFFEESLIRNRASVDLRTRSKLESSLNDILLSAIDEALSSLGENVAASIYFHVEKTFGIKRLEIPQRVKDFSAALEKIFGLGARTIEILCMKKFHEKIGFIYKWPEHKWPLCKWVVPEMAFHEYIDLMRQNYEKTRKGKSQTRKPIK